MLLLRRPGFDSLPVHVMLVMDRVGLGQIFFFSWVLFSPFDIIRPMVHTRRLLNAAVIRTSGLSRGTFQ